MKLKKLLVLALLCVQSLFAQDTVKVMFYNLLNFPSTQPSRVTDLQAIMGDVLPDLFLVCELENEQGGEFLFEEALEPLSVNYVAAPFVSNQSSSNQLHQLAYYNSNKLTLDNASTLQSDIITTDLRDINRYSFILNTPDAATNPIYLEVFVTHLKAGRASSDPNNPIRRTNQVNALTTYLNNNAATFSNRYVLFAGDFNVYTSNEDAFQEIIDADNNNSIDFVDPINRLGNWSSDVTFQDVHTQSTLRSNSHLLDEDGFPDGATGGLDDRFDFIMISDNLQGNAELEYVTNSYEAYGNNGNCYNDSINDSNCTGTYSQTIRNHLFNFSDHLPVVLQLQTNRTLTTGDFDVATTFSLPRGNVIDNEVVIQFEDLLVNKVEIFNTLGQQMEQLLMPNQPTVSVSATQWPKGIYYLVVDTNDGKLVTKLMKR